MAHHCVHPPRCGAPAASRGRPCFLLARRGASAAESRSLCVQNATAVPFRGRAGRIVPRCGGESASANRAEPMPRPLPPGPPPCACRSRKRTQKTAQWRHRLRLLVLAERGRRLALRAAACSARPPSARGRPLWWRPPSSPRSTPIARGAASGSWTARSSSATRAPSAGVDPCTPLTRLWTTL